MCLFRSLVLFGLRDVFLERTLKPLPINHSYHDVLRRAQSARRLLCDRRIVKDLDT